MSFALLSPPPLSQPPFLARPYLNSFNIRRTPAKPIISAARCAMTRGSSLRKFGARSRNSSFNGSESEARATDDDVEEDEEEDVEREFVLERWDVVGHGQAMVDFSGLSCGAQMSVFYLRLSRTEQLELLLSSQLRMLSALCSHISALRQSVEYDSFLASAVAKSKILIVEGYLFEFHDTIKTIAKACQDARKNGALVAVTASEVSCIKRHYDNFWEIIKSYADIIFASSSEARAFCNYS